MKKFHTSEKWDKEECPRAQQRQKLKTQESRKFSKYDSSEHKEEYFADENKSVRYRKHAYQVERRPNINQAFVKSTKDQAVNNYDSKKISCDMNLTIEHQYLNKANRNIEDPDHKGDYKELHNGFNPMCENKGNVNPDLKNKTFKNIYSQPINKEIQLKDKYPPMNDTEIEYFDIKEVNEKNSLRNIGVKDMHFSNENSVHVLQKISTLSYKSNQSSNVHFFNLSQNKAYQHEELSNSQSDGMHNSSQRADFLNNSTSYEDMGFNMLKLTDLIFYNANLMQDRQLLEYALAVKVRILEKIDKFQYPEKEELEFLCEITDSDQSEKNQRIITTRTCRIIRNLIDKFPHFMNILEAPLPSQILIYQAVPYSHGITNSYCGIYNSPVPEIVQNSEMMLTSAIDYNLMCDYNIAQNSKHVVSKGISDSFDSINSNGHVQNDKCVISKEIPESPVVTNFNDHNGSSEVQNFVADNARNNNLVNSSLIATKSKDLAEELSKNSCLSSVDSEECKPEQKFSFNEEKSVFILFGLENLLKYNTRAMRGDKVFDYGFSMKQKILEKIDSFVEPYKGKLNFLCELTDGTQREQNQKLINERMCDLINDFQNEMKPEQNLLDDQSRYVRPRRFQNDDEVIHNHKKNFLDGQSRNMHQRKSYEEKKIVRGHQQNFSDGQSRYVHHKENFSDDLLENVRLRRFHNNDKKELDQRQNFSNGQPRNVPPRLQCSARRT